MLAQLCGPDRKIIRLRDKRGIYLFLIEITAITKYLAAPTADPGEFARPDCWSGISEICWNIDSQVPCRPARPSARAWGRSSTPAFTPFCPKRSRGGRCSRRRPRFPRDPRRTTRCRVRGLRLRTLLSGHAIARFGIAVAVWLNAGLLAATALAEQPIGCALLCSKSLRQRLAAPLLVALGLGDRTR